MVYSVLCKKNRKEPCRRCIRKAIRKGHRQEVTASQSLGHKPDKKRKSRIEEAVELLQALRISSDEENPNCVSETFCGNAIEIEKCNQLEPRCNMQIELSNSDFGAMALENTIGNSISADSIANASEKKRISDKCQCYPCRVAGILNNDEDQETAVVYEHSANLQEESVRSEYFVEPVDYSKAKPNHAAVVAEISGTHQVESEDSEPIYFGKVISNLTEVATEQSTSHEDESERMKRNERFVLEPVDYSKAKPNHAAVVAEISGNHQVESEDSEPIYFVKVISNLAEVATEQSTSHKEESERFVLEPVDCSKAKHNLAEISGNHQVESSEQIDFGKVISNLAEVAAEQSTSDKEESDRMKRNERFVLEPVDCSKVKTNLAEISGNHQVEFSEQIDFGKVISNQPEVASEESSVVEPNEAANVAGNSAHFQVESEKFLPSKGLEQPGRKLVVNSKAIPNCSEFYAENSLHCLDIVLGKEIADSATLLQNKLNKDDSKNSPIVCDYSANNPGSVDCVQIDEIFRDGNVEDEVKRRVGTLKEGEKKLRKNVGKGSGKMDRNYIKCFHCRETFSSESTLNRHVKVMHKQLELSKRINRPYSGSENDHLDIEDKNCELVKNKKDTPKPCSSVSTSTTSESGDKLKRQRRTSGKGREKVLESYNRKGWREDCRRLKKIEVENLQVGAMNKMVNSTSNIGDRWLQCYLCPNYYFDKSTLNKNLKRHHCVKRIDNSKVKRQFLGNSKGKRKIMAEGKMGICNSQVKRRMSHFTAKNSIRTNRKNTATCFQCHKRYPNASSLKKHLFVAHGHKQRKCPYCRRVFLRLASRKKHIISMHENIKASSKSLEQRTTFRFYCEKCGSEFDNKSLLSLHLNFEGCAEAETPRKSNDNTGNELVKHEPGPQKDSRTQRQSIDVGDSLAGEKATDSSEDPLTCVQCRTIFSYRRTLLRHTRDVHGPQSKPIRCVECRKIFSCRRYLQKHMKDKHGRQSKSRTKTAGESLTCAECNHTFVYRRTLMRHIRNSHMNNKSSASDSKIQLREKTKASSKSPEQGAIFRFYCEKCGGVFHNKSLLSLHVNFECHIEAEDIEESTENHVCEIEKPEPGQQRDSSSIRFDNGEMKNRKMDRKYRKCFQCRETTLNSRVKSVHMKVKVLECPDCTYSCSRYDHFFKHLKTHDLVERRKERKARRDAAKINRTMCKRSKIEDARKGSEEKPKRRNTALNSVRKKLDINENQRETQSCHDTHVEEAVRFGQSSAKMKENRSKPHRTEKFDDDEIVGMGKFSTSIKENRAETQRNDEFLKDCDGANVETGRSRNKNADSSKLGGTSSAFDTTRCAVELNKLTESQTLVYLNRTQIRHDFGLSKGHEAIGAAPERRSEIASTCITKQTTENALCSSSVNKEPVANTHTEIVDVSKKKLECIECRLRFSTKDSLLRHLRIHSTDEEKKFKCYDCPYRSWRKDKLMAHRRIHIKEDGKTFECTECPSSFFLKSNLVKHLRIHREGDENQSFQFGERPYRHSEIVHASKKKLEKVQVSKKKLECIECRLRFSRKRHLIRHLTAHSKDEEKKLKCSECPYRCWRRDELMAHRRIHIKEDGKTFECAECPSSFFLKLNLVRHLRIHRENEEKN